MVLLEAGVERLTTAPKTDRSVAFEPRKPWLMAPKGVERLASGDGLLTGFEARFLLSVVAEVVDAVKWLCWCSSSVLTLGNIAPHHGCRQMYPWKLLCLSINWRARTK